MLDSSVFRPGLLDGQVALVTGGGTGIGFGISELLAGLGAHVVMASRKPEHLEPAVEKLRAAGGKASAYAPGGANFALGANPDVTAQKSKAFDASEGTRLDPLRNRTFDLNSAKSVPALKQP
jgi:NAD(P)-dependent dehydrogenase (short-subunit alcohol dehydrogenase family)